MQFISLPNDVYSFAELNRLSLSQCRFKYLYQIWNAGLNLKSRICIRLIQMFCWWHLCLWRLLAYVSSSYLKICPPVYAVQDKRSSMLDPKLSERHTGSTNGFGNKVKKAAALMERWSVSLKARFLKRKLLQRLICVLPMKTWRISVWWCLAAATVPIQSSAWWDWFAASVYKYDFKRGWGAHSQHSVKSPPPNWYLRKKIKLKTRLYMYVCMCVFTQHYQ